jgi:hypothetical protein
MTHIFTFEECDFTNKTIFLAGGTIRTLDKVKDNSNSWRYKAVKFFEENNYNYTLIIPEYRSPLDVDFNYEKQIEWENKMLTNCDVILFWIPRDMENLPCLTTNIEFGEYHKSGKIVVGGNEVKNNYIKYKCKVNGINFRSTLEQTIIDAMEKLKEIK